MTCKVRVGYTGATRTQDQYRVDSMASKLMSALTAEVPEKPHQPKEASLWSAAVNLGDASYECILQKIF